MNEYLSAHNEIIDFFGCAPILYATLRVTGRCNLYCKHCYASASNTVDTSSELSFEEQVQLLNELHSMGVSRLSISGGEPFCRQDIYDILKVASDLGFDIYISTNGISNISANKLSKIRIKVLQVSIDGLEQTHDVIRGKTGAFSRAVRFLEEIHNYHTTNIGVAFSLMQSNRHETIKLFEYLHDMSLADVFSVIPVQKLGRADQSEVLSVTDLHAILSELSAYYLRSDRTIELNIMVPPAIVPQQLANTKYGKGYVCEFPYSIAIDANGNCALCDGLLNLSEFKATNIRNCTDYYGGIYQNSSGKQWLNLSPATLEGVCKKCCFASLCCGGCRIDAFLNTGSYYASDPLCQRYYDAGLFPKEFIISE